MISGPLTWIHLAETSAGFDELEKIQFSEDFPLMYVSGGNVWGNAITVTL